MATFSKWVDWRTMARDLSSKLRHLSIADNVDKGEFLSRTYTPSFLSYSAMPIENLDIVEARFWKVREKVAVSIRAIFTLASGYGSIPGVELVNSFYVSLPFPAKGANNTQITPGYEYRTANGFFGGRLESAFGASNSMQNPSIKVFPKLDDPHWLKIVHNDGTGIEYKFFPSIAPSDYFLTINGEYLVDERYTYKTEAYPATSFTPTNDATDYWTDLSSGFPSLAFCDAPAVLGTVTVHYVKQHIHGEAVSLVCSLELETTVAATARVGFYTPTIPLVGAGCTVGTFINVGGGVGWECGGAAVGGSPSAVSFYRQGLANFPVGVHDLRASVHYEKNHG